MPDSLRRLIFALLLTLASSALGQVTFTITATVDPQDSGPTLDHNNEDVLAYSGYTPGQTVTFTFTTESTFTGSGSLSTVMKRIWTADYPTDGTLWNAISGTGLGGAYTRPAESSSNIWVSTGTSNPFRLLATDQASISMGLTVNGRDVRAIILTDTNLAAPSFSNFNPSYLDPDDYFTNPASYISGDPFTPIAFTAGVLTVEFDGSVVYFTPSSVAISLAAVPEPSAYAALAGAVALGLATLRRRLAT